MPNQSKRFLAWIVRTLVVWGAEVLGLALMAWLLPGVQIASLRDGVIFIAVVGILNALLWPLLTYLTLPFMVYTVGIGALLLNALVLWLGSLLVPGVNFSGLVALILTAIGITAINLLVSFLLTIDDEGSYYRHALHRQARRARGKEPVPGYPGVVFIEIDGLSEPEVRRAIREGHMPTLARWVSSGSHRLVAWETDTSCQTGGCQAGILHGNNADMPAFRWVDKAQGNRLMTSSNPIDAPEIEARISDGNGLLAVNGYSRVNMFSGDAADPLMTMGRMTGLSKVYTPFFYTFFASPYNLTRTIVLFGLEIVREWRSRRRQERHNIWPRLGRDKRGGLYPVKRAAMTVVMHEILTDTLVGDIFLGRGDAVYATYAGYDELAHYVGLADPDTMHGLARLDQAIGRLQRVAQEADRPYQFVVLSDHGQSKGATFKQRYKLTLEELVRDLLPTDIKLHSRLEANEGWERLNATVTDVAHDEHLAGRTLRSMTRKYQEGEQVVLGPEHVRLEQEHQGQVMAAEDAQVMVLASGNLGLVYFADWPQRMSYEEINRAFPDLIPGLVNHEGIGFVLANSESDGGLVIGRSGTYFLEDDRVEGDNPLADFRPRAAQHLRRTNDFGNAPDLLVNSFYDPELDEGAAFEEQIGFHGGLGGAQAWGFLLYPSQWSLDEGEIVGAEEVYRRLKPQLDGLRTTGTV